MTARESADSLPRLWALTLVEALPSPTPQVSLYTEEAYTENFYEFTVLDLHTATNKQLALLGSYDFL